MKLIPLTQGKFAMVDDADFEAVNAHKWHAAKRKLVFYGARDFCNPEGRWVKQLLHRFLLPGIPEIDHRDGDGLNNQRHNLRPATTQQNRQGFRRKRAGVTSKFRGVSWHKRELKWQASLTLNKKFIFLGYFTDETKAAHAYDSAAVFYFGEWASTNFDIGQITIT